MVLPLATLLGLTERPGEAHGFGSLDPDLCRELAIAAASSPWTQFCVTVTDQDGVAIGHGCARPHHGDKRNPVCLPVLGLPARVNLTIPAARLPELAAAILSSPSGQSPWSFTPNNDSGPPGNFGTWALTRPGGRNLTVHLLRVPTFDCDHRHESHAYQPNDTLRHLVQIRDGTCTFPPCSRHARESDFEHAVPYDKGGRTCAGNAGAQPRLSSDQAVTRLDGDPAQARLAPVDNPVRSHLHPGAQALPRLSPRPDTGRKSPGGPEILWIAIDAAKRGPGHGTRLDRARSRD